MMQGDYWIIRNDFHKQSVAAFISTIPVDPVKPYTVKVEPLSENRRASQNRLSHMWYSEVSKQGGEYTAGQVKCKAKLKFGVPILIAEDSKFAEFWTKLQSLKLSKEEQEEAMEFIPVTSIMSVKQMSQYLSDFQRVMGQKYQLTDPEMLGLDSINY